MNIALITAGGTGERTKQDIPKQFLHIENKPIIIYTLEAFQRHPSIDAILVVCLDGWHEILRAYAKQFNITKLRWIATGGKNGQESIYNGLLELCEVCGDDDLVLIHDSIRPMVTQDTISDAIATALKHGCAIPVIPCMEVMLISNDSYSSSDGMDRSCLKRTQTPQAFRYGHINRQYKEATESNISLIAPCDVVTQFGETVYFSKGSEKNLKISTLEDLEIFKALLKVEKDPYLN